MSRSRALGALCAFAAALHAQACLPGDVLLKNDILPPIPSGTPTVAIVGGLCDGEAAMAVLAAPGPVDVRKVSVMFGAQLGTNGVIAAVDVEIYDGATVNAQGIWTLGPRVFQLSSTGSNLQIQSHAINEYTLPTAVHCNSGKVVVGWRMVLNGASGSCTSGYTADFCCDFGAACTAGRNILDALGVGPVDPATYTGFGLPLCPIYFRGDWIIRACVTPSISTTWSGTPTPGGAVLLTHLAPGHGAEYYITLLSLGTQPGTNSPWGFVPLNDDFLLECSIDPACSAPLLVNNRGTLNANGQATAVVLIPNLPFLINSNLAFYGGFVASLSPTGTPFTAVSSPTSPIFIN